MNEHATTSAEGNPAVEHAEEMLLGHDNYQKIEVVHQYANTHPFFHPLVGLGLLVIVVGMYWLIRRYLKR